MLNKVPEVWRWQDGKLTVNILTDAVYVESETSLAFESFPAPEVARFIQLDSQTDENARLRVQGMGATENINEI